MRVETLEVRTRSKTEFVDITSQVQQLVRNSGVRSGVCYLYVPHTTAGVTINENADPSVQKDLLMEVNKIIPFQDNYVHSEGNSAAHIKSSLFGNTLFVLIEDAALVLGTWQGIYFCEFDGARRRKIYLKIVSDA
ncbi:YjbQ family protein [candidate division KSB3 bacterium]|uniref:YjbQ family protein n=1 Tax=candidate division KSB3 bacterium TaxID=2044937 RepID=A0A9D5JT83_9BACT|nr:YjbQ family protein [candidate division KSB3 bacterium]